MITSDLFSLTYSLYYSSWLRSARHVMPTHAAAEDAVSSAILQAWSCRSQYAGQLEPLPLSRWISVIVRNTCLSQLRRDRAHEHVTNTISAYAGDQIPFLDRIASTPSSGDSNRFHSEVSSILHSHIRRLPPKQRAEMESELQERPTNKTNRHHAITSLRKYQQLREIKKAYE
jgi:DNA-directed RNA polymerase specialized sigma24 family protein